jgi:hypothetical protein
VPLPSWCVSWDGVVGLLWYADQPNGWLHSVVVIARERSEDNRSDTWHPTIVASVITLDGGSHTWEWNNICRAPAAASVIALVDAPHSGSHDLSLRASGWGATFQEIAERRQRNFLPFSSRTS